MIRVDVLGGLRVVHNGCEQQELTKQPRRAALLVLLAVEREVAREHVLDLLWGERDPERARRALNQTVYELRRQLGEHAIVVQGERIGAGEQVQSDVAIFRQAAQNGDAGAALEIYRGAFLDGIYLSATHEFEEWCSRHRSRLGRQHRKLRLDHIDALRREGRTAAALALAARACEDDPADDDFQHRYVELLVAAGQRAEALRAYEAFAARLAAQGLAPLDHTRGLVAGLQAPEAAARAPVPEVPASLVPAPAGSASPGPAAVPVQRKGRPGRRGQRVRALAALVVTALLTVAGISLWRDDGGLREAAPQRLAVLPFDDLTPGGGYGYLAQGLSDALIRELHQRLPDVAILSRASAARLKGAEPDSIARALGAALLLDGGITRGPDGVRLRLELVDASTQNVVRAAEVHAPWTNELEVVSGLVTSVMDEVRPVLGRQVRTRELETSTRSAAAYALYLRAADAGDAANRLASAQDWAGATHLLELADSLLAVAEATDAHWAEPAVLRAEYGQHRALLLVMAGRAADTAVLHRQIEVALAHAERAVQRDPGEASALAVRGALRAHWTALAPRETQEQRNHWLEAAASDLRSAVAIDARRADVWLRLAEVYFRQGRFPQARDAARNANRLDAYGTLSADLFERLSTFAFETGDDARARHWCDQGRLRFPDDPRYQLCHSLLLATQPVPALDSLARIAAEGGRLPRSSGFPVIFELHYALALARSGDHAAAEAQIDAARERGYSTEALWREAVVRAELGQFDAAVALLREFDARQPGAEAMYFSRLLEPLRRQPAYAARSEISPSR